MYPEPLPPEPLPLVQTAHDYQAYFHQAYFTATLDLDTLADHADLAGQKPEIVLALHNAAQMLRSKLKEMRLK